VTRENPDGITALTPGQRAYIDVLERNVRALGDIHHGLEDIRATTTNHGDRLDKMERWLRDALGDVDRAVADLKVALAIADPKAAGAGAAVSLARWRTVQKIVNSWWFGGLVVGIVGAVLHFMFPRYVPEPTPVPEIGAHEAKSGENR